METATARQSNIYDPGIMSTPNTVGISPDVARYCFIPLLRKPVSGIDFKTPDGHLPINQFFVVRSFSNTITDVTNGGRKTVARPAKDQADDVQRIASREGGMAFGELSALQNDQEANLIVSVLENPNICEKYPEELGTTCLTCWGRYLNREAEGEIAKLPLQLQPTAQATLVQLQDSIGRGTIYANDMFRTSVDAVEGNKKAKLSAQDRINMRHAHLDEPNFSGVLGQTTGLGAEIAKGITEAMGAPKMDTGAIATIIAEQLAPMQDEMAKLRAENEALRSRSDSTDKDVNDLKFKTGEEVIYEGEKREIVSQGFGKLHLGIDGEKVTVEKDEVEKIDEG